MYSIRTLAGRLMPKIPKATGSQQVAISARRGERPGRADAAFQAFRRAYPAYDSTRLLDRLRVTEYARLDRQGHVYLDYTGGGLYAESQLRDHFAQLSERVF